MRGRSDRDLSLTSIRRRLATSVCMPEGRTEKFLLALMHGFISDPAVKIYSSAVEWRSCVFIVLEHAESGATVSC